jgi:lipoprotein-releasing system permease protein
VGILISSLQVGLVDTVTGNSPHVTISSNTSTGTIENWQDIINQVEPLNSVSSVAVSAFSPTLVSANGKTISAQIKGFEIASADVIYKFSGSIDGRMPATDNEVIIGTVLKEELGLGLMDALEITNSDRTTRNVNITGFFELGSAFTDSWVVMPLGTCQSIFGLGNNVTSIEIQVDEVFKADIVAQDITIQLNDATLKVSNWKGSNADLLTALQSQSLSSYMIQGFVLISVVIAITSVLAITVVQKSRQIGILKAMGIKDRTASMIFLYQGLILGILGAIGGILIGLFLLYGFIFGTSSGDKAPIIELIIDFRFIALSGIIAVTSAIVASLIPARRSSSLSPVEVIRNG